MGFNKVKWGLQLETRHKFAIVRNLNGVKYGENGIAVTNMHLIEFLRGFVKYSV